jgi:hypothetical protein
VRGKHAVHGIPVRDSKPASHGASHIKDDLKTPVYKIAEKISLNKEDVPVIKGVRPINGG